MMIPKKSVMCYCIPFNTSRSGGMPGCRGFGGIVYLTTQTKPEGGHAVEHTEPRRRL